MQHRYHGEICWTRSSSLNASLLLCRRAGSRGQACVWVKEAKIAYTHTFNEPGIKTAP